MCVRQFYYINVVQVGSDSSTYQYLDNFVLYLRQYLL